VCDTIRAPLNVMMRMHTAKDHIVCSHSLLLENNVRVR
jgi:hypothetical protein